MGVMKRAAASGRRINYGRGGVADTARRFKGGKRDGGRFAGSGLEVGVELRGSLSTSAKFDELELQTRRKLLRKAMVAASREIRKEVKRQTPRATGLLRRSIGSKVQKYQKGAYYLAIIGQAKGLEKQKGFSAAAAKATSHKKRGGLSGEGVVLPLWLVNNPVQAHAMPGSNRKKRNPKKPYVFMGWGKKQFRKHIPNHPGHDGDGFIQRGARHSERAAAAAFQRRMREETDAEVRKLQAKKAGK